MYYGGICDSDKWFCLSICLLALSIWQTRCVMYNISNFGQINNFLVLVLVVRAWRFFQIKIIWVALLPEKGEPQSIFVNMFGVCYMLTL